MRATTRVVLVLRQNNRRGTTSPHTPRSANFRLHCSSAMDAGAFSTTAVGAALAANSGLKALPRSPASGLLRGVEDGLDFVGAELREACVDLGRATQDVARVEVVL